MIDLIQRKIGLKIAIKANSFILVVTILLVGILFFELSSQYDQQLTAKGKMASIIGAKSIGIIFAEAIDNNALTLSDVLDTNYEEIVGFNPPKYHTKYDRYTDKAFLTLQDEFLKSSDLIYAMATDVNGYLPTHNTKYSHSISGQREKDLTGNRTKRIFKDDVGVKAGKNTEPGFVQKYYRDTGEVVWDISSPIYVKGKHWGSFRVGLELKQINQTKEKLRMTLGIIVLIILLISMTSLFVFINRSLRPLSDFTRVASDLADGKMDEKIVWESKDEIGKLADVLERLRISLKAAMERLSR